MERNLNFTILPKQKKVNKRKYSGNSAKETDKANAAAWISNLLAWIF